MPKSIESRLREKGINENEFIENTKLLGWDWAMSKLEIKTELPLSRFFLERTGNANFGRYSGRRSSRDSVSDNLFKVFTRTLMDEVEQRLYKVTVERNEIKEMYEQQLRINELLRAQVEDYKKREYAGVEEDMIAYIRQKGGELQLANG